jgi:hypothetical protein
LKVFQDEKGGFLSFFWSGLSDASTSGAPFEAAIS